LQSAAEVHEVVQDEETGSVSGVTLAAVGFGQSLEVTPTAEVGGDPTVVMLVEVELVTCQGDGVYTRWYFSGAPSILSSEGSDKSLFLFSSSSSNRAW
jgi:hypothetical protein